MSAAVEAPSTEIDGKDKVEESAPAPTEAEAESNALKQIEFYLGDSNLPYDKFMWTLHTKNSEHWIPIATLASFKRMSEFKPYGLPWLVAALRKSDGVIEVDGEGVNVRRARQLVPPGTTQLESSVYAKGFGKETPGMQKELETFFEKWGPIGAVRMRREKESPLEFKGSAFCEYKDPASAQAFLSSDPKPKWGESELLIMSKDGYVTMKCKEKGFSVPDRTTFFPGNKSNRSFNAFKIMAEETKKAKKGSGDAGSDDEEETKQQQYEITVDGHKILVAADGSFKDEDLKYKKGKVLKFIGDFEGPIPTLEIKEAISNVYERKPFVDKSGFASFPEIVDEQHLASIREKGSTVDGVSIIWSAPTDEEERVFWNMRADFFAKQAIEGGSTTGRSRGGGRGGGRNGRGNRGGRGGRGGNRGGGRGRGGARSHGGDNDRKRKREDESGTGAEGTTSSPTKGTVPTVAVAAKKAKVDNE